MRFSKILLLFFSFISSVCCQHEDLESIPEYKIIKQFSKRIKEETGLKLDCYGVNDGFPNGYKFKNGLGSFSVAYRLYKSQEDTISVEEARCLLVSVAESFLNEINSNLEIRKELDVYPFTIDLIKVSIYFVDENDVDLGTGISTVYFYEGRIKYNDYQIIEYRKGNSLGKSSTIREESYEEALSIVKQQNCLRQL